MKEFLSWIVEDETRERRFLTTLSLMEYIGCRKIIKSLSYRQITDTILQHISEEASHSFLLRKVIKQVWGQEGSWDLEPWSLFAWNYFNYVEQDASSSLVEQELCYPLVSQLVEKRVLDFYPLLIELSSHDEVKAVARIILAQEKRHARFFESDFPELEKKEDLRAQEFMDAIRAEHAEAISQRV